MDKGINLKENKKIITALTDCGEELCKAITFAQQRLILKKIDVPKYRNFFFFCCCTGMRVCEALSIKVKNIDKNKNLIRINMPDSKTKKHKRIVPFAPELFSGISLSGVRLFNDITEDGSRQYFAKLYKDLKLDLCRHSARHTFISVCTHAGINEQLIQSWVGHTTLKMTVKTYTHKLRKGNSPILDYIKILKNSHQN